MAMSVGQIRYSSRGAPSTTLQYLVKDEVVTQDPQGAVGAWHEIGGDTDRHASRSE
jgi:hypothetical protein